MTTIRKNNVELEIVRDIDPESPREWDNAGKMVLNHSGYTFPNEIDVDFNEFNSIEELMEFVTKEHNAEVILTVRSYEHGGISLSTSSSGQYSCRWDSSVIGIIFMDKKAMKENNMTEKDAKKCLNQEVETYNQYLNNDVYGFRLKNIVKCDKCGHEESEEIESCYGFYAFKDIKDNVPKVFHKDLDELPYID